MLLPHDARYRRQFRVYLCWRHSTPRDPVDQGFHEALVHSVRVLVVEGPLIDALERTKESGKLSAAPVAHEIADMLGELFGL